MEDPWKERMKLEDERNGVFSDKRIKGAVTKHIDWEYPLLRFFKRLFKRRKDNVDKV